MTMLVTLEAAGPRLDRRPPWWRPFKRAYWDGKQEGISLAWIDDELTPRAYTFVSSDGFSVTLRGDPPLRMGDVLRCERTGETALVENEPEMLVTFDVRRGVGARDGVYYEAPVEGDRVVLIGSAS